MAPLRNRDQTISTNVVRFSGGLAFRLEKAIEAFDKGGIDIDLYDEFKYLSENGVTEAHFFLGCMCEDGTNGQSVSKEAGLQHYEIAATEIGYVEAYLGAARLYLAGAPSPENIKRAFQYYKYVADNTCNAIACFRLGRMYHLGYGIEADLVNANLLYKRAVEQGSVYGMLFAALLEFDKAHYFNWLKLRISALKLTLYLSVTNRRDSRLRAW